MPTLAFSDYHDVGAFTPDASVLASGSFTPTNGDVIVVKAQTYSNSITAGTPSGGGQTFTSRVVVAPAGFRGYSEIWTAVVAGSPGSMTVSLSAPSGNSHHDLTVEVWTSAKLAATPATGSGNADASAPSATITTTGTSSVVSWCCVDAISTDPTGHAYLSSATEDGFATAGSSNAVFYAAYQAAASPGAQTFGMSAPATQYWNLAAVEVQDVSSVASTPPHRPIVACGFAVQRACL
jgi:hypothetical protein